MSMEKVSAKKPPPIYVTWCRSAADNLSHAVTDERFAEGVARQEGRYHAVCGHEILVVSCLVPPGTACPECYRYVQAHLALLREIEGRLSAGRRDRTGLPHVVARLVAAVLASDSPVIPRPRSGRVSAPARRV